MHRPPRLSDSVARVLAFVVVAVMATFLVVYTVHKATGRVPALVLDYLHINTEMAFASWFNAGLLLVVAVLSGLLGYSEEEGRRRTAWTVVALTAAYLSLDEATELHEKAGRLIAKVPQLDIGTFHWVVPGAIVASAGVGLLVWVTRPLEESRRRLGVALVAYLTGALGVELVTGLLIRTFSDVWVVVAVVQPALVILEESLEMLACIYAIRALLAHVEDHWEARPRLVDTRV